LVFDFYPMRMQPVTKPPRRTGTGKSGPTMKMSSPAFGGEITAAEGRRTQTKEDLIY